MPFQASPPRAVTDDNKAHPGQCGHRSEQLDALLGSQATDEPDEKVVAGMFVVPRLVPSLRVKQVAVDSARPHRDRPDSVSTQLVGGGAGRRQGQIGRIVNLSKPVPQHRHAHAEAVTPCEGGEVRLEDGDGRNTERLCCPDGGCTEHDRGCEVDDVRFDLLKQSTKVAGRARDRQSAISRQRDGRNAPHVDQMTVCADVGLAARSDHRDGMSAEGKLRGDLPDRVDHAVHSRTERFCRDSYAHLMTVAAVAFRAMCSTQPSGEFRVARGIRLIRDMSSVTPCC